MIDKAKGKGMKDNVAARLHHVLDKNPKTYAELFEMTVMVSRDHVMRRAVVDIAFSFPAASTSYPVLCARQWWKQKEKIRYQVQNLQEG